MASPSVRTAPARRPQPAAIKTGVDHTRGFTKYPHEYEYLATAKKDADGEFRPMLSGLLQSNLIYWIGRNTFGKESRPEWARISITQLAQLCGAAERKSVATALADLLKRGIIAAPLREGCAANTPKMYKLCPENWRKAQPYRAEVDADLLALAKAVEAGWMKQDTQEDDMEEARRTRIEVAPGKRSKPQPVALPVKGAEPFIVRVVYHSEFDEPMTFRARPGHNGRLQVTACRPVANVVWGCAERPEADEGKANACGSARPHAEAPFAENTELARYRDYLNALVLKLWNTAKADGWIRDVFETAEGAPLDLFRSQVEIKFKASQGNERFLKEARNHQPGLLRSLAADAARAHKLKTELEKARPDKMADNQPQTHPEPLNPSRRWDRIRAHLRTQLSEESYYNWFAFTRQLEETKHATTVAVQDETTAENLRTEYGQVIEMAAAFLGEPVRIVWRPEQ